MKIKEITPNTRTFAITDENKGTIVVTIDFSSYSLSAKTDFDNYYYQWKPTESESFLSLLCRLDKEYLMSKISDRCQLDVHKSIEETIAQIKLYGHELSNEDIEEIEGITSIVGSATDSKRFLFYNEMEKFLCERKIKGASDLIMMLCDYPADAINFVDIFCGEFTKTILYPLLAEDAAKKLLAKKEADNG